MVQRSFRNWFVAMGLLLYAAALAAAPSTVLVLGDSLSAAFGMEAHEGWVSLLAKRLAHEDKQWQVINASVSGETSAGGRTRLPALLAQHRPAVVIIELGGNDGLRALPLPRLGENLAAMVDEAHAAGAKVLLVGMRIPPNYGPLYTRRFEQVYRDLAREMDVPLVPFLLAGVAGDATLMQPDGVHAAETAQPKLLENVWPALRPLLR